MLWVPEIEPELGEGNTRFMRRASMRMQIPVNPLHELVTILWRRRRVIVAIAVIGTALAAGIGLSIPPKYTATVQLIVQLPAGSTAERAPGVTLMDESVDTHVTLLSSRDHLERVLASLSQDAEHSAGMSTEAPATPAMTHSPQPTALDEPAVTTRTESNRSNGLWDHLRVWIRTLRSGGNAGVPSLEDFQRNTKVMQERRSRVLSVAFTSTSPEKAAAFANRIAQLYVDRLLGQARAYARDEIARLNARLSQTKHEMDEAGIAVQNAIQRRIGSERGAETNQSDSTTQLRELERRAASSAQLYGGLLRRQMQMRIQEQDTTPGIEIQSLATVPRRPSSHNPLFFIIPAFFVCVVAGGWLTVALEQRDRGLRCERDVRDMLGIPCIGLVPKLPRKSAERADQILLTAPFSPYSEAIRALIAHLHLSAKKATNDVLTKKAQDRTRPLNKILLVSSSVPSEGKTTLARSLAFGVALFGRRVLLVDCDFRQKLPNGRQEEAIDQAGATLKLQTQRPDKDIQRVSELGLDYLSLRRYCVDPLVFLAREQTRHLLRELAESYDCVIVDGPPLLGVAESRLLASLVDRVVFVVKWGSTSRAAAQNALSLVSGFDCFDDDRDSLVAVVTQVDLKKHAEYHYGDAAECFVKYGTSSRDHRGPVAAISNENAAFSGNACSDRKVMANETDKCGEWPRNDRPVIDGDDDRQLPNQCA
jgi:polysaccharide biosynthesis transport protein